MRPQNSRPAEKSAGRLWVLVGFGAMARRGEGPSAVAGKPQGDGLRLLRPVQEGGLAVTL